MAEGESGGDRPFIEVRGLHHSFGAHHVLRGIDLDVVRGETLVLIGRSGGGKSVLLKHLPGLLKPSQGEVRVDGVEISGLKERELSAVRRKVGIMFQGGALFDSLTVGQNVAFPLREAGLRDEQEIARRVAKALEIVHLAGQQPKLPADLSGGMRKRVALARTVVTRPQCVLFDEPHAGLDPLTGDSIDRLIKCLQCDLGITNVVVTHEMRSVYRIADRILFLEQGLVHWTGTPAEMQASADPLVKGFVNGGLEDDW